MTQPAMTATPQEEARLAHIIDSIDGLFDLGQGHIAGVLELSQMTWRRIKETALGDPGALRAQPPQPTGDAGKLSDAEIERAALQYLTDVGWGGKGDVAAVMTKFVRTIMDRAQPRQATE